MTNQAFWTLVGLEFRRSRRSLVRIGVVLLAIVVFALMAESTMSVLSFGLTAVGLGIGVQIPFDAIHDKLTGGLEVLTTLPLGATMLTGARLTAVVLGAALGAVLAGVAGGIVGPVFLEDTGRVRIIIGAFLAAWVLLSSLSAALTAVVLRFKTKLLAAYGALAVFGVTFGGFYIVDRLFGGPLPFIQAVVTSDHTLAIAVGSALVGSAVVLTASFLLTRRGFEIYQPEPDAMDW